MIQIGDQLKFDLPFILLDGSLGQELVNRGVHSDDGLWSARALFTSPETVLDIHREYIDAGADIITTNTYTTIMNRLEPAGLGDQFNEINSLAGQLAVQARDSTDKFVAIAGSLPPLGGSYRPDLVADFDQNLAQYHHQASVLAPFVDLFICETMTTAAEARAAAEAALATGKPVMVSWSLLDGQSARIRSGQRYTEAAASLSYLALSGFLANCCTPESITNTIADMVSTGVSIVGGYANGFAPMPAKWKYAPGISLPPARTDLHPDDYLTYIAAWIEAGANLVGGCCQIGPTHIHRINQYRNGLSE